MRRVPKVLAGMLNRFRQGLFWVSSLAMLFFIAAPLAQAENEDMLEVKVSGGQEIHVRRYAAAGDTLALWIGASFGYHERHEQVSRALAARGVEVWQADFIESLFMPRGSDSMRQLKADYVTDLIASAHARSGKQIVLLARGYDAIGALRGVRVWQSRKPGKPYLIGAVLFSPELYSGVPALGMQPRYVDVTYATNIPVMIYQGEKRGNRWNLPALLSHLQQGGAQVYFQVEQGVNDLFYHKDDSPATLAGLQYLPAQLIGIFKLLAKTPTPRQAAPLLTHTDTIKTRLDYELRPFMADLKPIPIDLYDIDGKHIVRNDYRGKVTVINFWATWCPPCVQEIPSLNRLRAKMQGYAFELISVNYAETPEHVRQFMQEIKVDFPVLMDVTGADSAKWNVIAYPSTFVIGPDGKIHYGVNAAIEWDEDPIVNTLQKLLQP